MKPQYTAYLIDDDKFLLDMYALKFKNAGHIVTAFQDGYLALDALKNSPAPDVLLVDIIMPNIDGFGILEAIKKEQLAPTMKKIVLSNQGQQEDIDRAKELGAVGYIIKASATPSEVYAETIAIIEKK
jgi:two-component system, chemotaxis family, chemotaxis protein CheY